MTYARAMVETKAPRGRGHVRRRGNSLQVLVYSGVDPLTGKDSYLTESVPIGSGKDAARAAERKAEKVRTRLLAERDAARAVATSATLARAIQEWLGVAELEISTRQTYQGYIDHYIVPVLGSTPLKRLQVQTLDQFYASLRRCRIRCTGRPKMEHLEAGPHECRQVIHKRKREHDCEAAKCRVLECRMHQCEPLSASTVRQIHSIIRATLTNAHRWGWIPDNPAREARKPAQPKPRPQPPSPADAARMVNEAFAEDPQWGTLVWLVMVTGMRRGELAPLRWADIDLDGQVVRIYKSYLARSGVKVEKDTKTHQDRTPAIDPDTVELLQAHRAHCAEQMAALGVTSLDDTYVFSADPHRRRPWHPDSLTHRYGRLATRLGIDTSLKALRHYNATELIRSGVDLRTVAGRLGHGGGGTTTLRVYAAFVPESDRRAAGIIAGRMPRPTSPVT
jgi:integrase